MSSLLDRYARDAAATLGHRTVCSLTLSERGILRQVAGNDPRAVACVRVETREGTGPCSLAMARPHSVLIEEDLGAETRWPRWRRAAHAHGFRSFVAFPANVDDDVAATLTSEDLATWTRGELVAMDASVLDLAAALRVLPGS